jgi:hypothetical protein
VIGSLNFALYEDRILDRNTGQMVNPNMEWYLVAGMSDIRAELLVAMVEGKQNWHPAFRQRTPRYHFVSTLYRGGICVRIHDPYEVASTQQSPEQ